MVIRNLRWRSIKSCLLMAAMLGGVPILARGDEPPEPPKSEPKPKDGSDELQLWMARVTGLTLSSRSQRDDRLVRTAFRDVVAQVRPYIVRVYSGEDQVALGTIIDADGFVLTKASELYGKLSCKLADGRQLAARTVGIEKESDLAVLRIDATELPTVKWGDDANPPAVGSWLVTVAHDELPAAIGVISNSPRKVIAASGVLGVMLDINGTAAKVNEILPTSGAEKAGVQVNDVITHVNGTEVATRQALVETVQKHQPGEVVELKIKRGDELLTMKATLGDRSMGPNSERAALQNTLGGRLSDRRGGFPAVLQHDTVLRPNLCGGPVFNLDGQAVGVNIARAGRVASYALPAAVVVPLLEELKSGRLAPPEDSTVKTSVTNKPQE